MNSPSSSTVGASRSPARSRSFSRTTVHHASGEAWGRVSVTSTRAAPPAPPALGFFTPRLPVARLPLADRPPDRVLGLQALHGRGVHAGDDVLRVDLAGLGVGRTRVAVHARGLGGRAIELHRGVDLGPHRVLLPVLGGAD